MDITDMIRAVQGALGIETDGRAGQGDAPHGAFLHVDQGLPPRGCLDGCPDVSNALQACK